MIRMLIFDHIKRLTEKKHTHIYLYYNETEKQQKKKLIFILIISVCTTLQSQSLLFHIQCGSAAISNAREHQYQFVCVDIVKNTEKALCPLGGAKTEICVEAWEIDIN